MIDGVFRHQDSNGGGGLITDGDTQWMTAGAELSFWLTMRLADL
jgi:redox-sensitive bicupin YhaK (pirin superfamily)